MTTPTGGLPPAITMFDSVDPGQIPADAAAVAGYVNGHWPTYAGLVAAHPHAHVLSIAVSSSADADCLDVEQGDATIEVAPAWVTRQLERNVRRPAVYTSVSQAKALLLALSDHGIKQKDIRLWTAHYSYRPHLCSIACGFGMPGVADATQWSDKAYGRNLDASMVAWTFFGVRPPAPKPAPAVVPQAGEPKNEAPFTHIMWPSPIPQWFWTWAQWRVDGESYQRPWNTPTDIPAWAWDRLKALEAGS